MPGLLLAFADVVDEDLLHVGSSRFGHIVDPLFMHLPLQVLLRHLRQLAFLPRVASDLHQVLVVALIFLLLLSAGPELLLFVQGGDLLGGQQVAGLLRLLLMLHDLVVELGKFMVG